MKQIAKEYLLLFNVMTDVEEALRGLQAKLVEAQQRAEALYLEDGIPEEDDVSRPA